MCWPHAWSNWSDPFVGAYNISFQQRMCEHCKKIQRREL